MTIISRFIWKRERQRDRELERQTTKKPHDCLIVLRDKETTDLVLNINNPILDCSTG